jgi:teichuronic acid biosynthesis glycosyltransferase TuaC
MCSICGVYNVGSRGPVSQGLVEQLTRLISHPFGLAPHVSSRSVVGRCVWSSKLVIPERRRQSTLATTGTTSQATGQPFRVLMVTGVYPTEKLPHKGTFIKSQVDSLSAVGVEIEVLHPRPGPILLRYPLTMMGVFLKALSGHFDIVHGHYGQWCLFARMQWATPVVASFLGDDLLGTVTTNGSYSTMSRLVVRMSHWLCRRVDAVIVKSEAMKKAASGGNVFVIPNGVDFDLFRPTPRAEARAALGWDHGHYYVLFGNDPKIPVKNFPLAQAAIECLRSRGIPAELVVATGLPQTTLVQYINASNALILSSVAEGSPNVVKETMACNVPVVSTEVGDVSQVIGRTKGCRVCPHDPVALATALEQALRHSEPTTGRADIMHLDRSVVAKQVIAVYEQVISKK